MSGSVKGTGTYAVFTCGFSRIGSTTSRAVSAALFVLLRAQLQLRDRLDVVGMREEVDRLDLLDFIRIRQV